MTAAIQTAMPAPSVLLAGIVLERIAVSDSLLLAHVILAVSTVTGCRFTCDGTVHGTRVKSQG